MIPNSTVKERVEVNTGTKSENMAVIRVVVGRKIHNIRQKPFWTTFIPFLLLYYSLNNLNQIIFLRGKHVIIDNVVLHWPFKTHNILIDDQIFPCMSRHIF